MVVKGSHVAVVIQHCLAHDIRVLFGNHVEDGVVTNNGVLRLACRATGALVRLDSEMLQDRSGPTAYRFCPDSTLGPYSPSA